jgi:putative inorganic carbon (HCO3(-)) transporter
MRDLALSLFFLVLAPVALRFPFVGVYLWAWLAVMNPHRLTYGFAQELPFNMAIAVLTVVGCFFSAARVSLKVTGLTILVAIFSAWISLTTAFAPSPDVSEPLWDRNIKTMVLLFMIMALITNRAKLQGLVWILVISLGYFGVKGGAFMVLTGGNFIVFGPSHSMIEDNNALALALVMTLPLMNYLRLHTPHKFVRLGLVGAMLMTLAAAIGSYSRGGLIALGVMLVFLWLRGRAKLATAVLAVMAVVTAWVFMPDKYADRIGTINELQNDDSFRGRMDAWEVALGVASDRVMGAGFDGPRQGAIWTQYLPEAEPRASHSIYFMVLGEHGFIGLAIYLSICLAAWLNLARIIKLTRNRPDLLWAGDLGRAIQAAMVGFMVGGAALPMAYYDGFLVSIAMTACLRRMVEEAAVRETRTRQAEPVVAGGYPGFEGA